eukprot:m.535730 g.535730  ORF g.535730 m.535730 type:complete len:293 (+) comp57620_c0_seq1:120-998(+)
MSSDAGQPGLVKSFLAGGAGGVCLVVVGHPFDTVKVRVQTSNPRIGAMQAIRQISAKDGLTGLYRGMGAPLTGVTPMYALCFFGYGVGKKIFCDPDAFEKLKLTQIGLAGVTSAVFTTPILAPGERLKCVLQVQSMNPQGQQFKGPIDVAKHLYATGGVSSVNRGFVATFMRDGLASAFYFTTYELLKVYFTPDGEKSPSAAGTFVAGGFAGIANWLACMPLDVLKNRLQADLTGKYKHGIRSVFAELIRTEGPLALYRGFLPTMARAFPANAATFLGYEGAIQFLSWVGLD